jgi:hypothetical protein
MAGKPCGVREVMSEMTAEDRAAFQALLDAPIAATAVERELASAKFAVSYQTIYRHRAQTCSCRKVSNERIQ